MTKVDHFMAYVGLVSCFFLGLMMLVVGLILLGPKEAPPIGVFLLIVSGVIFFALYKWHIYLQRKGVEIEKSSRELRKIETECAEAGRIQDQKREKNLNTLRQQCNHEPVVATVMGGSGWNLIKGEVPLLSCRPDSLHLCCNILTMKEITIPFSQLVNIEVTGPGTETSNAGIIGGGFGLEGAAKGILAATVINALTTSSKTNTFLRLATSSAEIMLHITTLDPTELRLLLSTAFVKMEANKQIKPIQSDRSDTLLSNEIEKLHQMFSDGILTEEEFTSAKKGLFSRNAVT